MKAKLVFSLVTFYALGLSAKPLNDWADYPGMLHGSVIQAAPEGFLVDGVFTIGDKNGVVKDIDGNTVYDHYPHPIEGTFWVRMSGKQYVSPLFPGESVGFAAIPDGSFSYTTALGVQQTVRAVRFTE